MMVKNTSNYWAVWCTNCKIQAFLLLIHLDSFAYIFYIIFYSYWIYLTNNFVRHWQKMNYVYFFLSFREIFWHQIHVSPDSISTGKAVQSEWKTPKMWTPHQIQCFHRHVCLAKPHPWAYYQITRWIACKCLSQRWRFAAQNLISDGCPWTFMCG